MSERSFEDMVEVCGNNRPARDSRKSGHDTQSMWRFNDFVAKSAFKQLVETRASERALNMSSGSLEPSCLKEPRDRRCRPRHSFVRFEEELLSAGKSPRNRSAGADKRHYAAVPCDGLNQTCHRG